MCAMGRVKHTSDFEGCAGTGMSFPGGGRAGGGGATAGGAAAGASGTGGTGASTQPICETDFFFCLAICLRSRGLQGPAVPLTLLHFLWRAGVSDLATLLTEGWRSATSLAGTSISAEQFAHRLSTCSTTCRYIHTEVYPMTSRV